MSESKCPSCQADFDGGPIPEEMREHYSPPYRWSRRIGISNGDSVFAWACPDCRHTWPRAGWEDRQPKISPKISPDVAETA
jgi:hypothetical protein